MTDRPRLSRRYVAALGSIALLAVLFVLTWLGVPPFDNIFVFVLSNVVGFFALLVLGVLGGAFLGMLLTHRLLSLRDFSPFERAVMENLAEIKETTRRLEEAAGELRERVEEIEGRKVRR